jgi:Flp pilus assembly protein TadG
MPTLILVLVGAVDFGRAFYVCIEVQTAAEAGALYGVQYPTDIAGMEEAAQLNAQDVPGMTPVATWGSECSDGTSPTAEPAASPTCATGTVEYVEVDTSATYIPIIPYPGIQSLFTVTGKARMRASF